MSDAARPIIVLGSQRSGTTEMSRLFTKVLGYKGEGEGHVWPGVTAAWRELDATVKKLGGVNSRPYRSFTIGRIGVRKIKRRLSSVIADIYEEEFGPKWMDKTPGAQMVRAVPMLKDAIPGVRFVFMRRRGIENVMSKQRRFPERSFEAACDEWADTMSAWLDVRLLVKEQCIEIDQMVMATCPSQVAEELCAFLGENDETEAAIRAYLSETRSEQTNPVSMGKTTALDKTNWSEEQTRIFCEKCAPMMAMYGYSFDGVSFDSSEAPMSMPLMFTKSANVIVESPSQKTGFRWDGLKIICLNNKSVESIKINNIATAGQNTFESSIRIGGVPGAKTVTLNFIFRIAGAEDLTFSMEYDSGTLEEIALPLGDVDGPLAIEVCATADGAADGVTNLSLERPRLTYRAPADEQREIASIDV